MKKEKLVIFGEGLYTEIVHDYLSNDERYEIVAFTKNKEFIGTNNYLGLPMVPFETITKTHPPSEFKMHLALSYTNMNRLREERYYQAKKKGYRLISYISPQCTWKTKHPIGDNCFIFEDNTIQPFVQIGSNVVLWSGNHIGHHGKIKDHNFISSHVVVSGQCTIESNCFIGVNSTINHGITIGKLTLVGAGSIITKDTEEESVYVPARSVKLDKKSSEFKL